MTKVVSATDAVARIPDNAVVTVSSSSALGCPDLVLKALGERFDAEGAPRALTMLHPIAAGDMYGVKGVDHIAKDGLYNGAEQEKLASEVMRGPRYEIRLDLGLGQGEFWVLTCDLGHAYVQENADYRS